MCRFLAWVGQQRYLDELVLEQEQSLVIQSRNALIGKTPINADGFGLAWYSDRDTPCFYKDTHPAWSDANLKQLAHHTKSRLFLAHVRASTGTATSRNNCHPFGVGRWSFMHNGQAGGHERIRQELDAMIPAHLYLHRMGATESEAIFLIAHGEGLDTDPVGAMARAVGRVEALSRRRGASPYLRFAACWSDGKRVFAARYASDRFAPSLHYKACKDGIIISSEPLDAINEGWLEIQPNTAIETEGATVTTRAFAPCVPQQREWVA
ncbi:class II glutamine amidotransferase [Ruegeria sp. THAF33]|uniref:class II glutamine amidotransferase n=1 Tax=Ruegeria sp. THAF33 TaxID=2587853 RepID=UPI001269503B|nr:class II glutamine amidotransferase [Ruegeria sp. THAF33]QFT71894.1 Amidohydrolase EgtC [Ruegeria sp. THAF33]